MVNGSWLMVRWFDGSMAVVVAVAVVDDGQRLTVAVAAAVVDDGEDDNDHYY